MDLKIDKSMSEEEALNIALDIMNDGPTNDETLKAFLILNNMVISRMRARHELEGRTQMAMEAVGKLF